MDEPKPTPEPKDVKALAAHLTRMKKELLQEIKHLTTKVETLTERVDALENVTDDDKEGGDDW